MKRRLPKYALSFSFVLALAAAGHGETAVDRAREGEARQEQIQAESQNLVVQLDAMMDEYQRNALSGEEIKTFQELRALLSRLTDQEMEKIKTVLQNGAAKNDPQAAIKAIADAYAAQKGVLGEFKRVLAEHERNQEALRLSRDVNDLADRQAAVLQTGIEAAQFSLASKQGKAQIEASMAGQAAEQKAIGEDLKLLREKIGAFAKNEQNKDAAPRFAKGLEEAAKVAPKLEAAVKALDDKQVFNAVTAQKAARDEMRDMARTIAPPKDEAETLRHASEQVDKLLAQQKEALAMAKGVKEQTMPEWIAEQLKDPKSGVAKLAAAKKESDPAKLAKEKELAWRFKEKVNEKNGNLAGIENRQGDLVNQTDAVSREVAAVAKPVADALQAAIPKMQEARAAANAKAAEPAAKAIEQAMAAMEKAKADLGQRLAAVEGVKNEPGDPLAKLQNLQKQTQDLMKQEEAIAQNAPPAQAAANAAQQAALQQKAQQLQKQAAAAAPAAAPALAKAVANMQQAAAAMNNPAQAAAAAPAQQQAMQNLAQANQQVGQQIAQMQGAQAAAAALQQEVTALAKVIADEQKIEVETVTAAALPKTAHPLLLALAPRQETVRVATDDLKNPPAPAAGAAPAAPLDPKLLASATGHMTSAKGALEKPDGKAADPEEQLALKDLYALQDSAQAQLASAQANQPPAPAAAAAAAANAAAALAQAQAQVAQAAAALAAASPPAGAPPAGAPPAPGAPPAAAPAAGAPPAAAPAAGAPPAGAQAAAAPAPGAPAPGAPAPGAPAPGAPAAGAPPAGAMAGAPAPGAPAAGAPGAPAPGAARKPAPGGAPSPAMAKAAGQLGGAASAVGAAAAQAGAAPQPAKDALRDAAAALTNAAAQAAANDGAAAQAATADAQQALAQAQAALAQAQAGISAAGGPPGAPGAPGGPPGKPSPGGPPMPGAPSPGGTGEGAWTPGGALTAQAGGVVSGKAQFIGLPERDRATIRQAQSEKYPQQYAADVEQYLRNLSDESTPK